MRCWVFCFLEKLTCEVLGFCFLEKLTCEMLGFSFLEKLTCERLSFLLLKLRWEGEVIAFFREVNLWGAQLAVF